jgi:hypothetical protein
MSPVGSAAVWKRKVSRIEHRCSENCVLPILAVICQILTHHWTVSHFGRTIAFAMNKTAEKTGNSSKPGDAGEPTAVGSPERLHLAEKPDLTAAELQSIQEEKLTAIRSAIARGDYDSDAILDLALNRMLERMEASENEQ